MTTITAKTAAPAIFRTLISTFSRIYFASNALRDGTLKRLSRFCYRSLAFRSSDLARLRARQFVCGTPTRDPRLDFIKGNGEPGPLEFIEAAAIFADIWLGQFHDVIYSVVRESGRLGNVM
jgi:hypothetical protein